MTDHIAFASGVLSPETHGRLVADIDNVAQDAAITQDWLWTPLADTVSPKEVSWVKRYRFHATEGKFGLCLTGKPMERSVEDHMSAIAGALVRNFIRARVFTVGKLLDALEGGDAPNPTCLVIPNFYLGKSAGATLPAWKVTALHDLLQYRQLRGKQTVLYVSDLKNLGVEYGPVVGQMIASRYEIVDIG